MCSQPFKLERYSGCCRCWGTTAQILFTRRGPFPRYEWYTDATFSKLTSTKLGPPKATTEQRPMTDKHEDVGGQKACPLPTSPRGGTKFTTVCVPEALGGSGWSWTPAKVASLLCSYPVSPVSFTSLLRRAVVLKVQSPDQQRQHLLGTSETSTSQVPLETFRFRNSGGWD